VSSGILERSLWLLRSLPREGRAGEGVVLWPIDGPPPSVPPLRGEGGDQAASVVVRHHHSAAAIPMPLARFFSMSRMARRYSTGMTLTNLGRIPTQLSRMSRALAEPV